MEKLSQNIPNSRWVRIVPACIFLYALSFIDRQVVSVALTGGMMKEFAMTASFGGLLSGIFAIGSMLLTVEGGHQAQKGRAKLFIVISTICWIMITFLTAYVHNVWEMLILRFLLGVSQGGLYPAILALLSNWFPEKERMTANSMFFTSNGLSQVVMGPLAGFLIAYGGWRQMYVILAAISLISLLIFIPSIADGPKNAKWLKEEEREYLISELEEEQRQIKLRTGTNVNGEKIPWNIILKNKSIWVLAGIYFCNSLGQFGFAMWIPTIIKNITKAGMVNVGLLMSLPNIAVIVGLWIWTLLGKRSENKVRYVMLPMLVFGVCLIINTFVMSDPFLGITMMCVTALSLQGVTPSFWSIPPALFPAEIAGASRGFISMFAGLGSFVGPYLVGILMSISNGSTSIGLYGAAFFLIVGGLLSLLLPKMGQQASMKVEDSTADDLITG